MQSPPLGSLSVGPFLCLAFLCFCFLRLSLHNRQGKYWTWKRTHLGTWYRQPPHLSPGSEPNPRFPRDPGCSHKKSAGAAWSCMWMRIVGGLAQAGRRQGMGLPRWLRAPWQTQLMHFDFDRGLLKQDCWGSQEVINSLPIHFPPGAESTCENQWKEISLAISQQ